MKTINLYKVLRVRKNATLAQIQKAFRKRAGETHPDKGGDPERFQEVHRAWKVLGNETKRKKYDETGVIDSDKPDNSKSILAGMLSGVFAGVMEGFLNTGKRVIHEDVILHMRRTLEKEKEKLQEGRKNLKRIESNLQDGQGRFVEEEGESMLSQMVEHHLGEVRKQLEKVSDQEVWNGKCLAYLEKCRFRHEPMKNGFSPSTNSLSFGYTLFGS